MSDFPSLNWFAVGGAAVAAFALSRVWFGPLFGKAWRAETGLTNDQIEGGSSAKILGIAFALNLFMSTGLAAFRVTNEITSLLMSTGFGVCVSVTFVVPVLATNNLFARRSWKQLAIGGGYFVSMFATMGFVQSLLGG